MPDVNNLSLLPAGHPRYHKMARQVRSPSNQPQTERLPSRNRPKQQMVLGVLEVRKRGKRLPQRATCKTKNSFSFLSYYAAFVICASVEWGLLSNQASASFWCIGIFQGRAYCRQLIFKYFCHQPSYKKLWTRSGTLAMRLLHEYWVLRNCFYGNGPLTSDLRSRYWITAASH